MAYPQLTMTTLLIHTTYPIELCSGEIRFWQYLGPDEKGQVWWRDTETKLEFSESSLMYAWRIKVPQADPCCES